MSYDPEPTKPIPQDILTANLEFEKALKPEAKTKLLKPSQIKQALRGTLRWKGMPMVPDRKQLRKEKRDRKRHLLIESTFATFLQKEKQAEERAKYGHLKTRLGENPFKNFEQKAEPTV